MQTNPAYRDAVFEDVLGNVETNVAVGTMLGASLLNTASNALGPLSLIHAPAEADTPQIGRDRPRQLTRRRSKQEVKYLESLGYKLVKDGDKWVFVK